tara:strand:- start:1662 stop:2267 length:606 start_codon:yes stop_codon:yes gene_type:complete
VIISLISACGSSNNDTTATTQDTANTTSPSETSKEEPRTSDRSKSVDAQDMAKVQGKAADKAAESAAGNVTVATGAGWGSGTSEFDVNMAKAEQTNKLLEAYWTSHIEYTPEIAKELLHPEYLEKGSMTIDEQINSLKSEGAKITFETDGTAARTGSSTLGMTVFITHPVEGELKYYMTFKETEKKNNEWRISNVEEMDNE